MSSEPTDQRERIEERATAFVFGELDREEATEFMKAMDASPEVRAMVASVRDAVGAIKAEFVADSDGVTLADRQRIEDAIRVPLPEPPPVASIGPDASTRLWVLGLAIAASLLLVAGLTLPALNRIIAANTDTQQLRERIGQIESDKQRLAAEKRSVEMELAEVRATLARNVASLIPPGRENQTNEIGEATETPSRTLAASNTEATHVNPPDSGADEIAPGDTVALAMPPASATDSQAKPTAQPQYENLAQAKPTRNISPENSVAMESIDASVEMENESAQAKGDAMQAALDVPAKSIQAHPLLAQPASPPYGRPRRPTAIANFGTDDPMGMGMDGMGQDMMMGMGGGGRRAPMTEDMAGMHPPMAGSVEITESDQFAPIIENPFLPVTSTPLSTFSIDVDTAAYAKVRMNLTQYNQWPNPDAVRIEELVNSFDYNYAPPQDDRPFAAAMEIAQCPWNPQHRLARIGIKAKVADADRPPSNLVFLLDVSGSMNRPNKLPLVVDGINTLVNQLRQHDSVAIVVYAGAAGLVLDATAGDRKKTIVDSLNRLRAGGSTNGGQGIQLAYSIARDHFIDGGTNRIILCSDGDFNVGVTDTDELIQLAEENAKRNISLSMLGFGSGNHNGTMMEQISNKGNGDYAFIDSQDAVRKVLVEQIQGSLVTVAKDVNLRVEFNPMEVESYRLIGYEDRPPSAGDFDDDSQDAGEIDAGHAVTALYEIVPRDKSQVDDPAADPEPFDVMKYQRRIRYSEQAASGEMLTLKLRYKPPTGDQSSLIEFSVKDSGKGFNRTDRDFQFAASVAAFGMLLRNSPHKGDCNFEMVEKIASAGALDDRSGYRQEFLSLVRQAKQLGRE